MIVNSKNSVSGHVTIRDIETGEILVDKDNAINFENFSISLARTIANRADSWIQEMVFGNGGATVSGTGVITYLPPNVVGEAAQLYRQTYSKVVNDQNPYNLDSSKNYMTVNHASGNTYTDVVVTCNLDLGEPSGQSAFDTSTELTSNFVFSELGLKSYSSSGPDTGRLLTHVIFSPIQKSLNRQIEVTYTIRIQTV